MKSLALILVLLIAAAPARACEDEYILPPEAIARCFFPTAKIPDHIWSAWVDRSSRPARMNDILAEAEDNQDIVIEIGEARAGRLEYYFSVSRKQNNLVAVEFLSSQKLPGMKPLPVNSNCSLTKWTPLPLPKR